MKVRRDGRFFHTGVKRTVRCVLLSVGYYSLRKTVDVLRPIPQDSDMASEAYVPVGEFFVGRHVFVTGGTGFLGKVLVEKLLRSCPGIKGIYLLIRPKKGRGLEERLQDITNCALFDKLRKENHSALDKVVPVLGDISKPGMGISASDWSLLTETVSLVFHCAATINFDEPLQVAVNINLLGTRRVLEICRQMTQLQALVHVSTCYCNCDLEEIKEVVYPPPYDPENVTQCIEWMDEELLAHIQPKLLRKHPNTYTFTKSLTENIVLKEGADLPVTIVRPSIVASSWTDPMPGWIESLSGPTAIVAAVSRGILRNVICDGNKITDIVPVDIVVNVMICAAWRLATARSTSLLVYNCCTGVTNPINWNDFKNHLMAVSGKYPSLDGLWYPSCNYHTNRITHSIRMVLSQVLPAYVLDLFLKITGKKPMLLNIQSKLRKGCQVLEYFTTREWRFCGENVKHLLGHLQGEDRRVFRFDVRDIDWKEYLGTYLLGVRTYIAKEDPKTIPQAVKHFERLFWMHRTFQISLTVLFGYWLTLFLQIHALT